MGRVGVMWVVATIIVSGGCSNSEGTKAPAAEQQGRRAGAVGGGGAGASLKSDGEFVHDVAIKNMTVVELSRLAVDKAAGRDIKAFAKEAIDAHDAAGTTLKSIGLEDPTEWPAQLDDEHRESVHELAGKHGGDFDREYLKAMIESYQDLTAKLESRLDVQSLADWKTAAAGRTQSKALPEPTTALHDVGIRPSQSSNETTMKINQWAADTYPVAQKHLDTVRTLENATKER